MGKRGDVSTQKNLAQTLMEQGLISPKQYEVVIAEHRKGGKRISKLLVEKGFITEGVKVNFLKKIYQLPIMRLTGLEIPDQIIQILPREIAEKYHVIPLKIEDNTLMVAMDDPSNPVVIDNLKLVTNMKIKPVISPDNEIQEILDRYYNDALETGFPRKQSLIKKWIHNIITFFIMFGPFVGFILYFVVYSEKTKESLDFFQNMDNQITASLVFALWVSIVYMIDSIFFREK